MPQMGFEPKVSAGERPQTYVLDRAANGTGNLTKFKIVILNYNTRKAGEIQVRVLCKP
jgi:hypothetical protein